MGRHCGWLAAATAYEYRKRLNDISFLPEIGVKKEKWEIHSLLLPEVEINFKEECNRLNKIMDQYDCVNVFLSEGAGMDLIIKETENQGKTILRDAFGHVRLDELNPGKWFAKELSKHLNANKILIQKSGYFARSSKPNKKDLNLIIKMADQAVKSAIKGINGVVGWDEENNNTLSCIEFDRIKGGKPFNINQNWYKKMIMEIQAI